MLEVPDVSAIDQQKSTIPCRTNVEAPTVKNPGLCLTTHDLKIMGYF